MQKLIAELKSKKSYLKFTEEEIKNKILNFMKNSIDNDLLEIISAAMQNNLDIMELNLSTCDLDYEGAEILAEGLAANNNIASLNLSNCHINDEKLELICESLKLNKSLKRLNISNNGIKHAIDPLCEIIRDSKNIQSLDLSRIAMDTKNIQKIANAIGTNDSIKELNLSNIGNYYNSPECIEMIKTVLTNKNLSSLNLSNNSIGDQVFRSILECLSNSKNIISINLSNNSNLFRFCDKIGTEDLEKMCNQLANNHHLKILNLSNTALSHGVHSILSKGIGQNTSIETLDLSYNYLGSDDNYEVVGILNDIIRNNKVLKHFNLADNNFSDKSLRLLINALDANNTIQLLDLSGHDIGDRATTKLNNYLKRNIEKATDASENSSQEEAELIKLSSDITLNEHNACAIIGDLNVVSSSVQY